MRRGGKGYNIRQRGKKEGSEQKRKEANIILVRDAADEVIE